MTTLATPSAAGDLTALEPLLTTDDFAKKVPAKRKPKKPANSSPPGGNSPPKRYRGNNSHDNLILT